MNLTTIPFSILSSCYIQPTLISPTTTIDDWSTTCNNNNNSICLPSGQCSNNNNNTNDNGTDCSTFITSHTNKCDITTNNQCECKPDFNGNDCELSIHCQSQKEKQCGNNGYIEYDIQLQQCININTCQCYILWIGNKCQQCGLQCFNNGKRYINCDKCGCDKGYSGEQCQCQTNIGIITLNGYREIYNAYQLILNQEKDNEFKSILLYELKDNADTLLNHITITLQQLLQLESILSIKLQLQQTNNPNYNNHNIDNDDNNTTNETIIEVQYHTIFKLTIQFNCPGYSQDLSLDELMQRWTSLQSSLLSSPIIRQYFIFTTNSSSQLEFTDLEPIDDSLPLPDQELKDVPNNAHSVISTFNPVRSTSLLSSITMLWIFIQFIF